MKPTKLVGLLLVIASMVALTVFAVLDVHGVFEHRLLLPVLNTLFAGIVPIFVAYVAGKAYMKDGSLTVLFMGCGMLSFGLCAISAGWLIRATGGANLNVTVYNVGAFCGSFFHAIGATLGLVGTSYSDDTGRRRIHIAVSYIVLMVFVICFSVAAWRGLVPLFFIQGVGPTDLRQAILGSAVLLYFVSSVFLMAHYLKRKTDFLYWYSLCLALLAIGLFAFFVQSSVGSPIGWLGRSANYVGGIFALVAILGALREAKTKGVRLERAVADSFVSTKAGSAGTFLAETPMPLILVLFVLLAAWDIRTVFEPPGLLAALNTLFLSILPLVVVYFATRGYIETGLFTMLMLGSGTLTFGLGSLFSGWVMTLEGGGPNATVTVLNLSAFAAAAFYLLGGVFVLIGVSPDKHLRFKKLIVTLTYLGIVVVLILLMAAALKHLTPVFFIQGEGSTAWREAVTWTAMTLFVISGLLFMSLYLVSRARLLYWYMLALFLFATGLVCYIFAKSIGSPIAWLGRSALYLAGIYLFLAVRSGSQELRVRGESLERGISNFFRNHLELLVEERTLQLSRAQEALQSAHNELELKVRERTAQLVKANELLNKEIAERIKAEKDRDRLFNLSLDMLCVAGFDGFFKQTNPAFTKTLGWSQEELSSRPWVEFVHPDDREKTESAREQLVDGTIVNFFENRYRCKEGSYRWLSWSSFPLVDEDLIFGVARDITERKRAEEELIRSNEDLQQFAYVASHDLQEPLRNVAACLQLLKKKYANKIDSTADEYINYAVEGAVRMKALIQDLLSYSRITTRGKQPERVDCEEILDRTVKNLGSAIAETGAEISYDPLPPVSGDDTQLLQVFQNLVGNAIKFRRIRPPQVHVSAVKDSNEWIFSVRDNGIGIESQYLDRIFVIFQRLHKRSRYEGTGMGLAIVKKVVERHGGRVWVESEPGVGTTFFFTIPEKGTLP